MAVSRNLRLYVPYHILSMEGICHGLYVLWLVQHKGLSPAWVAALLAAGDVVLAMLHVPMGMLADKLGRRASLIAGSAVQAAGLAAMWLGDGMWAMALSAFAIGLGDALRGGADEALLFETLQELGKTDEFERIVARTAVFEQSALVAMVLAGGWVASAVSFEAAWAVEVALSLAGLGVALAMRGTRTAAATRSQAAAPPAVDRKGDGPFWARFLPIIAPAAIAGTLASGASFAIEATWTAEPQNLTRVVAAFMAAEAAGSYMAGRWAWRGSPLGLTLICLALGAVSLSTPAAAIPAAAAVTLLHGWSLPVRAARIQALARDGQRATLASAGDTLDMVCNMAFLPLVGAWLTGPAGTPSLP